MAGSGRITPENFDLIVLGTGLQESILAAAAAASGLSVAHLDAADFYGAHWASLTFSQFYEWASSGGCFPGVASSFSPGHDVEDVSPSGDGDGGGTLVMVNYEVGSSTPSVAGNGSYEDHGGEGNSAVPGSDHSSSGLAAHGSECSSGVVAGKEVSSSEKELEVVELGYTNLYSEVNVGVYKEMGIGESRSYNIDLAGPKLVFCASQLVTVLLRSGASNYLDFKGLEGSYIWQHTGLSAVPSSRSDVFKDTSLSLADKRFLMRFFKLVSDYVNREGESSLGISREDLDRPFVEFMHGQQLPTPIQSTILYAITLVDNSQENQEEDSCTPLKTRDGLGKLGLYLSSVSRFPNAPGAFLYPLYGQGELPQAFCRSAAVNGTIYVLRWPVDAILVHKDSKEYKGIRTASGQKLFSQKLIVGPHYVPKGSDGTLSSLAGIEDAKTTSPAGSSFRALSTPCSTKVGRCVCITDRTLVAGQSTLLVTFPPRSVCSKSSKVIRVLQLGNSASVCPEGKFVVQLSTIFSDNLDVEEVLQAAVDTLFTKLEDADEDPSDGKINEKPKLLFSVFYVHPVRSSGADLAIPGVVEVCDMPDGALDCENLLTSTEKILNELFPGKDFFPHVAAEPIINEAIDD